jgi:hypothetical protein
LFELGIRMAIQKPVQIIKAKGTGPLFDVDNMYKDGNRLTVAAFGAGQTALV